ncbi:MAG: hypothetical protein SOZ59_12240 [Candidatus Limivivens sp.]|nr:hypothetical protein [Candidatus Limivivens sp.]
MRKKEDIYCNRCGKKLAGNGGVLTEDVLHVEKEWGYFSQKDGECHSFDLCEECCRELEETFQIPADVWEKKILI